MEEAAKILPAGIDYVQTPYDACRDADAVVLMTEWNQYRALDLERLQKMLRKPLFIDLRNVYTPETIKAEGFQYVGVGRS